jgi:arsenite methyltransferase
VLDIGCGDGIVGFGALSRVGESGRVIFSAPLGGAARDVPGDRGRRRALRVRAGVGDPAAARRRVRRRRGDALGADLRRREGAAFAELHRVLRPAGRLSIFEPINSFAYPQPRERFGFFDVGAVAELADEIRAYWRRTFGEGTLGGFDERDLVGCAEEAGFAAVSLDLEIRVGPAKLVPTWEAYVDSSPNPLAQTLREAVTDLSRRRRRNGS